MNTKRQYTIRGVPGQIDRILRGRSRQTGMSFNQVVLEALQLGSGEPPVTHDDLDFMIGSMTSEEVKQIEEDVAWQRRIDTEFWR
jgi:hypothetical protein